MRSERAAVLLARHHEKKLHHLRSKSAPGKRFLIVVNLGTVIQELRVLGSPTQHTDLVALGTKRLDES